ncbi:hypothetical protein PRUPE_3G171900 [Prunus persica]|uniref:Uncharacterized protein n=1 Tax=Prunus persica TaxID=3760 RepID=M5XBE2_PRUPE|nr:hypothetical protein PRUPE_3G171900 [Prunus persica]
MVHKRNNYITTNLSKRSCTFYFCPFICTPNAKKEQIIIKNASQAKLSSHKLMSCFLCCFLLSYKPKNAKLSPAQQIGEAPPNPNKARQLPYGARLV